MQSADSPAPSGPPRRSTFARVLHGQEYPHGVVVVVVVVVVVCVAAANGRVVRPTDQNIAQGGGGGNNSSSAGGSNADDTPYRGVTHVAGPNQDAPKYATTVEAGSTDASYSVVALKYRGGNGDDEENHYDMSAPGVKSRGKKAGKKTGRKAGKKEKKKQQRQQQQAPATV